MKAIITAVCLATSIFGNAQLAKTDLEKENLKGQVKSIKTKVEPIWTNEKNAEALTKDFTDIGETQYNLQGNKTQTEEYTAEDKVTRKITYSYNDDHQLLDETHYIEEQLNQTRKSHYDEKGTITIITHFPNNEDTIEEIYEYNPAKNSTQKMVYTSRAFIEKEIILYNKKGQTIDARVLGSSNKVLLKNIYKYDDNGNEILMSLYDENGRLDSQIKSQYLKYDAKGNWTEMKRIIDENLYEYITREIEYYE